MTRLRRLDDLAASQRARTMRQRPRTGLVGADGPTLRARRAKAVRRDTWPVRVARAAVAVAVLVFGIGLWNQPVRTVEVDGVLMSDLDAIESVASGLAGRRWVSPHFDDVRARLLDHAWVESVRMVRRLPDAIVIEVSEAAPVAWTGTDAQQLAVGTDGRVVLVPRGFDVRSLPRVTGLVDDQGAAIPAARDRLDALLAALSEGAWPFREGLARIDVADARALRLFTNDGIEVRLDPYRAAEQLRVAAVAWSHLEPGPGDKVDLRFERQAVLDRAGDS